MRKCIQFELLTKIVALSNDFGDVLCYAGLIEGMQNFIYTLPCGFYKNGIWACMQVPGVQKHLRRI